MTVCCYLGMGSNLRSPQRQLRQAVLQLRKIPNTVITHQSQIYFSKPLGVRAQPLYYNMAVEIHTSLPPTQLLRYCQDIENKHHRVRKRHWGARTLDIDVLLYGNQIINQAHLIIPHPQMTKRDFVLVPLLEINPLLRLPGGGPLTDYLNQCNKYITKIL